MGGGARSGDVVGEKPGARLSCAGVDGAGETTRRAGSGAPCTCPRGRLPSAPASHPRVSSTERLCKSCVSLPEELVSDSDGIRA